MHTLQNQVKSKVRIKAQRQKLNCHVKIQHQNCNHHSQCKFKSANLPGPSSGPSCFSETGTCCPNVCRPDVHTLTLTDLRSHIFQTPLDRNTHVRSTTRFHSRQSNNFGFGDRCCNNSRLHRREIPMCGKTGNSTRRLVGVSGSLSVIFVTLQ